jgi:CelD/BcsL family acetyltransferase involved in cellulose biosynthesis
MCIVASFKNKKLIGILPLVLTRKYGVKSYLGPGNQYLDRCTLLVEENGQRVARELVKKLKKEVRFYLSGVDEEFSEGLINTSGLNFRKTTICPYLELETDPNRFLQSKKRKRIIKALEEGQGNFWCKTFLDFSEELLGILIEIENSSFKKSIYKSSLSDSRLRKLLLSLSEQGSKDLLINLLYYKDEPISFQYGFLSKGVFNASNMAYMASFADFIPGRLLTYLVLPELIKLGITKMDFSRGNSQFKREFTRDFYQQYLVFYSANFFIKSWWREVERGFSFLEAHPKLFEIARISKNIMTKKLKSPRFGQLFFPDRDLLKT